jgi:hypothetical protein
MIAIPDPKTRAIERRPVGETVAWPQSERQGVIRPGDEKFYPGLAEH